MRARLYTENAQELVERKCDTDTSLFENRYVLFLGRGGLSWLSLLAISRSFLAAYPSTGTPKDTWTGARSAVRSVCFSNAAITSNMCHHVWKSDLSTCKPQFS